jgi:hypothetical protein
VKNKVVRNQYNKEQWNNKQNGPPSAFQAYPGKMHQNKCRMKNTATGNLQSNNKFEQNNNNNKGSEWYCNIGTTEWKGHQSEPHCRPLH